MWTSQGIAMPTLVLHAKCVFELPVLSHYSLWTM